jgi:hypothetical protein
MRAQENLYRGRDPYCECHIRISELRQNQNLTILPPNQIPSTHSHNNLNQHMRAQEKCIRAETPITSATFEIQN